MKKTIKLSAKEFIERSRVKSTENLVTLESITKVIEADQIEPNKRPAEVAAVNWLVAKLIFTCLEIDSNTDSSEFVGLRVLENFLEDIGLKGMNVDEYLDRDLRELMSLYRKDLKERHPELQLQQFSPFPPSFPSIGQLKNAKQKAKDKFKAVKGFIGVGIGDGHLNIYVDSDQTSMRIPPTLDGIKLKCVIGELKAF